MSGRVGSITTGIIADGLIFNMDAANRASYVPNATASFNTAKPLGTNSISSSLAGQLYNDTSFISPPTSASCWTFDGVDDHINPSPIWTPYLDGNRGTECSISIWLKSNDTTTGGIFDFAIWSTMFAKAASNRPIFQVGGVNYSNWTDGGQWDGNWHNMCLILPTTAATEASGVGFDYATSELYVDGVLQTVSLTAGTSFTSSAWNKFTFPTSGNYGQLACDIANISAYNRVLSASEVLHNYNALKGRFS